VEYDKLLVNIIIHAFCTNIVRQSYDNRSKTRSLFADCKLNLLLSRPAPAEEYYSPVRTNTSRLEHIWIYCIDDFLPCFGNKEVSSGVLPRHESRTLKCVRRGYSAKVALLGCHNAYIWSFCEFIEEQHSV